VLLALAEVHETWETWEPGPRDDWRWEDDGDEDVDDDASAEYELHGLIEDSFRLTRWSDPAAGWAQDIALVVDGPEACATTPTVRMHPHESHYEGYMATTATRSTAGTAARPWSSARGSTPSPTGPRRRRTGPWVSSSPAGPLVESWYGVPVARAYVVGRDRPQWLGSLPSLCEGLKSRGVPGTSVARRLSELAWDGLASSIHDAARSTVPRLDESGSHMPVRHSRPCSVPPG
jgi:hypothetical protein